MRLLILTQYYPPETGAPQNRLYELAVKLKSLGVEIEVLTAMPNYPKSEIFEAYKGKKYVKEEIGGITVHRTSIFVTKSKKIVPRLRNYFSFVKSSYFFGKKLAPFDYLLCESPPLFLGYSAMALSKRLKAKLIFNVSDLWPESAEKMGIVTNKFLLKRAYKLEAKCYRKSFLVTGQTQGIVADIRKRFPEKDVYWLPNGVNLDNFQTEKISPFGIRTKYGIDKDDLVLFYGGIIGHAQGLDLLIKTAANFSNKPVWFILMGSGPEKNDLIELSKQRNLKNVIFAEPVGRTEIGGVLAEIDVAVIPLRKLDLFLGAIPSKIFEALAMKKPLLLGVDGEARDLFIKEGKAGWFFEPENVEDLTAKINDILADREMISTCGENGRNYVAQKFDRNKIAEDFYKYIINKS